METSYVEKFVFDKLPIRGVYVHLSDAWQTISSQKEYPLGIKQLIGELLVANILLTTNLKLKGKVIAQIQGNPNIDLVVSECSNDFNIRATAKYSSAMQNDIQLTYNECLESGRLVMSIDTLSSGKLYQSIVSLNGESLANILDEYMIQSEQLKTRFILAYSENRVVGLMLQQFPDIDNKYLDDIERVFIILSTLSGHELLNTEIKILLHRLYSEDDIIILEPPHTVKFACSCGREKVANMLRSLGKEEAESIIAEKQKIEVTCDYCNSVYLFNEFDVHNLFCSLNLDMDNISFKVH